jgi:hypothetical protein
VNRLLPMLVSLLIGPLAEGADYFLKSPPTRTRADAFALSQAAAAEGFRSSRIVRHYRHGTGWEYMLIVDGFVDHADVVEGADRLTAAIGRSFSVFGGQVSLASDVAVEGPKTKVISELLDSQTILQRAVRAHGGVGGGREILESTPYLFRYRRQFGDTRATHFYAHLNGEIFLEVSLDEGQGSSSQTMVLDEGTWMIVDGETSVVDRERALEMTSAFSPSNILSLPLNIGQAMRSREPFSRMYVDGQVDVEGTACVLLRDGGDRFVPPMSVALDVGQFLVRQVHSGSFGDERVQLFSEYREVSSGLVIPHHIQTWRGSKKIDDIEIIGLEIDPLMPPEWFKGL